MKKISSTLKTKNDLIEELALKKNLSLKLSALCIDTIKNEMTTALLKNQRIELRGFGSFGVKKYKSYKGQNPQTQKKITVPSKKRPWFKAGVFSKSLNKK